MTHAHGYFAKRIASYIEFFIPDPFLLKIGRNTLRSLVCLVAGALILYAFTWFCTVLVIAIHSIANVFQAVYVAIDGNYAGVFAIFIIWLMLLFSIKATSVLLPSILSSFGVQGGRV